MDLLFAAFRNEMPDHNYHKGRVVAEVASSEQAPEYGSWTVRRSMPI